MLYYLVDISHLILNNSNICVLIVFVIFKNFLSIFINLYNFLFSDIFVQISTNIYDIFVKSNYQYIRIYRYFYPWMPIGFLSSNQKMTLWK